MNPFTTLPTSLLLLLHASFALAQQRQQLALDSLTTLMPQTPTSYTFTLSNSANLSVSVALCAQASSPPQFFFTNDSSIDIGDGKAINLTDGYGAWTGPVRNGALLVVTAGTTPFQVGVSEDNPMHAVLSADALPLLGDTTSNQALLFSPPFGTSPDPEPTFPNYTFPQANASIPPAPTPSPRHTPLLFRTADAPGSAFPITGCALTSAAGQANVGDAQSQDFWRRDTGEWREEWLVGALAPLTNYTAYVIVNDTKVSGPINFVTKSASFSCPLVHRLPYCPNAAWAIPLAPPPFPLEAHDASSLPPAMISPMLEYLTNFTIALGTFPCGRDVYSPLQTCTACQAAYRRWLCAVQLPRCSEAPSASPSSSTLQPAFVTQDAGVPARNANLPPPRARWVELLPCLETCHAVDRACPTFLGFKCPVPRFNANESYGVGFVDGDGEDKEGKGSAGVPQDRWGNVWCNAG